MASGKPELVRASKRRRNFLNYMKGWSTAASHGAIPPELRDDPEFSKGWHAGREAEKAASAHASAEYGYTPIVVTIK